MPPAEADPSETMFFQRREKRRFHLLPFLVLAILLVGGVGLLGWAYLRSLKPAPPLTPKSSSSAAAETATTADPSRGRAVLTPEEARRAGDGPPP